MLRIILLLITLLVSFSASAEIDQSSDSLPLANTITQSVSKQINVHDDSLTSAQDSETKKGPTSEQPVSENQSKSIDFVRPVLVNQLSIKQQPSPEYILIYELLSEQINAFANLEEDLAQTPPPWFINYVGSCSRLSGWKDSNSQYASKVTYHLS